MWQLHLCDLTSIFLESHNTTGPICSRSIKLGGQRRCSGESSPLPPMWPRFDSSLVPYVGGVCCWSLPSLRVPPPPPGSPVFLPLQKPTSPNSNLTRTDDPQENKHVASSLNRHYLLANKNFMRQFNHLYSYHVIYI